MLLRAADLIKTTIFGAEKKSCGIFIEFSIVHKIGYNNAI